MDASEIRVVDVVQSPGHEKYLYKCLAPHPFRPYRKRTQYLEAAKPKGLRKEILFVGGDAIGEIEYVPVEASAYPISGDGIWAMSCIWVLRRAKGHNFGKLLMKRMLESIEDAVGLATIALEGHHSGWLEFKHMEHLGFRSIDSRRMRHKVKRPGSCFTTHLMWMPLKDGATPPRMDWERMLYGVDFCIAHPLYRAERFGSEKVYEFC